MAPRIKLNGVVITSEDGKGPALVDPEILSCDGYQFLLLRKGNKELSAWTTQRRAYSTKVSDAIDKLRALQRDASLTFLGYEKQSNQSDYKVRKDVSRVLELQHQSNTKTIQVTLPGSDPPLVVMMPLECQPANAVLPLDALCVEWFPRWVRSLPDPEKHTAENPPVDGKYWHKRKASYVKKSADEIDEDNQNDVDMDDSQHREPDDTNVLENDDAAHD